MEMKQNTWINWNVGTQYFSIFKVYIFQVLRAFYRWTLMRVLQMFALHLMRIYFFIADLINILLRVNSFGNERLVVGVVSHWIALPLWMSQNVIGLLMVPEKYSSVCLISWHLRVECFDIYYSSRFVHTPTCNLLSYRGRFTIFVDYTGTLQPSFPQYKME